MAHVYADRPPGRTALGRALDRRLLDRRTCVAFRDIRGLAEQAVRDAPAAADAPEPVVADLAAGPAPYLLSAVAGHRSARAVLCDIDAGRARRRAGRPRSGSASAAARRSSAPTRSTAHALAALAPRPDVVLELGLYGIYHDDAVIERHFRDLAELVAPAPDRLQRPDPQPGDRVHRAGLASTRPASAASGGCGRSSRSSATPPRPGTTPASITADRFGHLPRRAPVRAEPAHDATSSPGAADPAAPGALAVSERLRALQRSHHAMWNYVTYRDAIALVGLDADDLYPERHDAAARRLGRPRLADVLLPGRPHRRRRGDARRGRAPTRSTCTRPT